MRQLIGFAAVAALAACGGSEGGGNASGGGGGGKAADVAMQPGEWEMTATLLKMSVPGAPSQPTPPPQSSRRCISAQDLASPTKGLVQDANNPSCTFETNSVSGGEIRFAFRCPSPQGEMRATVNGRYTATTVELDQQIRVQSAAGQMEIDARTTGRRVGECPAGQQQGGGQAGGAQPGGAQAGNSM